MADNSFDRTPLYPLEKPLSVDLNQGYSQADRSLRDMLGQIFGQRSSAASSGLALVSGCVGAGLKVYPQAVPALGVTIQAGFGIIQDDTDTPSAIGGILGLDDLSGQKPLVLENNLDVVVPAPPGANSRIDIIQVRLDRTLENPQSRQILNTVSGNFAPNNLNKTLSFNIEDSVGYVTTPTANTTAIGYKSGLAAGVPVAPTVDAGYMKLCEITVAAGAVTITAAQISDFRKILTPGNVAPVYGSFNVNWNGGAPIVTVNSIIAPPGIQLGLKPSTLTRGAGGLFIVGGNILTATMTVNGSSTNVLGVAEIVISYINGPGAPVSAATAPNLVSMAAATPSLLTAVGAPIVIAGYNSKYQTAGTTNVTDPQLELMILNFAGAVAY